MIKAVLFDFDETLQDRTEAFEDYMAAFLDTYCPDISDDEREKRMQDMRITGNGGYVNRVKWCTQLCRMWNWNDAPPAEELAMHYDKNFGDFNIIFPDSSKLMQQLKEMGYLVGIITNGPSILQHHKLDTSGLRKYCDIIVVSGDINIHKPDPGIFLYAAEKIGLRPEECVYVGDHPINDIQGARSAGMKPIRMNYGWFKDQDLMDNVPVIEEIIDVLNVLPDIK